MIDRDVTRSMAQKILDDDSAKSEIVRIFKKDCCFIVYYQTKAFLETTDPRYTYGRYPIMIDKFDGSNQRMRFAGIPPIHYEDKFIEEYKGRDIYSKYGLLN